MAESIAQAQIELEPSLVPNLLEELGHEEATLFGQTGTINELADKCPYAGEGMDVEAANMFVVVALNESGASIDERYMPYFTQVLEDRGMDIKVSVREPEQAATEQLEPDRHKEVLVLKEPSEHRDAQALALPKLQKAPQEIERADADYRALDNGRVGVATVAQMEQWLLHMQADYEVHMTEASDAAPALAYDEHIRASAPTISRPVSTGAAVRETMPKILTKVVEKRRRDESLVIEGAAVPESFRTGRVLGVVETEPKAKSKVPIEPGGLVTIPEIIKKTYDKDVSREEESDQSEPFLGLRVSKDTTGMAHEMAYDNQEDTIAAEESEHDGYYAEVPQDLPQALVELFDEVIKEEGQLEVRASLAEDNIAETFVEDEKNFTELFTEQVRALPELPDKKPEEQPKAILDTVLSVALKLQEAQQNKDLAPEAIEEIKEELEAICRQLFESMGIEADDKVVARFIEKVLASDLSRVMQQKLTPQELAKLGTHEYKLEDWFHKFKHLLDDTLHPHQTMGRLALRLNMTLAV